MAGSPLRLSRRASCKTMRWHGAPTPGRKSRATEPKGCPALAATGSGLGWPAGMSSSRPARCSRASR
eukprot:11769869-Heterocapsa_arctica.AAC.1